MRLAIRRVRRNAGRLLVEASQEAVITAGCDRGAVRYRGYGGKRCACEAASGRRAMSTGLSPAAVFRCACICRRTAGRRDFCTRRKSRSAPGDGPRVRRTYSTHNMDIVLRAPSLSPLLSRCNFPSAQARPTIGCVALVGSPVDFSRKNGSGQG